MNLTMQVVEAGQHVMAGAPHAAGNGIFDLINLKTADAVTTAKNVAVLIATILVLVKAWAARGAVTAIIVAALTAAIFLWIVNNIGAVQTRVGTEVNGLRAPVVHVVDVPVGVGLQGRID